MSFAQRIRRARRLLSMSQAELARRLHVDRSCVGHWEGIHNHHPGHEHLAELAKALAVSYEWLATGRGEMKVGHDPLNDVPAAFGKLVDDPEMLRLLQAWEHIDSRSRAAILEIVERLVLVRKARKTKEIEVVQLESGLYDKDTGAQVKK